MSSSSGRTLAEELELQATRAELGLVDAFEPVPVGDEQRFLVREVIGQGGMGTIYLAHDQRLRRDVALKMVLCRLEHGRLEHRLQREARALAALRHENVLQVYDLAKTPAGELFIAMEYVRGPNLRQWQKGRSLDEILDVYLQAGEGLAAAHERGIVHRDLKPDNVLVDESRSCPRALVADFGLAGEGPEAEDDAAMLESSSASHQTHGLVGTLAYMAPEQLLREPADARSDQHQFCVALWEAIVGERPFPSRGCSLKPHAPLPPRPPGMPRIVHRVLVRGLAFERRDRFVDMAQLLGALERGRRWRRARPWLAGGVLSGAAALGAARALAPDPCVPASERMTEIWTEEARQEINAAFRAVPAEFADDLAGYLVTGIDQAAARWTSRAQGVCEARARAPAPDPALERRHTCLERWADRMERRVQRLRAPDPDPKRAARAYELVAPMLELEDECRLPPALVDEQVQAKIEESEDAELLGHDEDALSLAKEAVALAHARGQACQADPVGTDVVFSHELAAAYYREGYALRKGSASAEALESLARAHLHAVACNDEQRDVDAQVHRAKIMAVDFEDVPGAERVLQEARARAGGLAEGALAPRRSEIWKAAGLIATHRGDYEQARAHYEEGLGALGDPAEHPILAAKLISNLGVTFQYQERYEEAARAYERAFALVAAALGPDHPETRNRGARRALNLGLLALERREHDVARQRLREAVAAGEPGLAVSAYTAWAQIEQATGSIERAEQVARELVALLDEHPGLPRRVAATASITAGQILAERRDPRGVELLSWAVDAFVAEGDHETVQTARYLLARGLRELGRAAEARARLEEIEGDPPVPSELTQPLIDLERSLSP